MKKIIAFLAFVFIICIFGIPTTGFAKDKVVYVVPIEETVEKGLYAFLKRAVTTAEEKQADAIIFEINTPGGAVDAAGEIGKLLSSTDLFTIALVNKHALSAGAYISLNVDEIYMVPGSTMGSAAIIDQAGNTAGEKAESYWFAAMKSAANQSGRDPIYALAMADKTIDLPEYKKNGKLLTLTPEQAIEVGYSEGTVANLDELLVKLGYEDAQIRRVDESFAEKVARFITHPVVVPILLSIGSLGLVLELYSPGFGIPGFMGITSLLMFFYGHMVAGLAGYETLILFVLGIGLVLLEFFIPGGIVGVIGTISILASLFLATDNVVHMGISILISIGISIFASIIMIRVFGKKMSLFNKIILNDSTSTERGYVSNRNRTELLGVTGTTITPLRPSGTVLIGKERIDVVSEGEYIPHDRQVTVIVVEGARVVVREIK